LQHIVRQLFGKIRGQPALHGIGDWACAFNQLAHRSADFDAETAALVRRS
jgi:hypothetical protein